MASPTFETLLYDLDQGVATITTPTFGQAAFSSLGGIAVASAGDLLVADAGNQVLRRVPVSSASDTIYGVAPNALFSLGPIAQTAP